MASFVLETLDNRDNKKKYREFHTPIVTICITQDTCIKLNLIMLCPHNVDILIEFKYSPQLEISLKIKRFHWARRFSKM